VYRLPLLVPRHACSPRDHVRAGDVWRLVQEAAVAHSAAVGWPPSRYREVVGGWVVRELVGVHHRELHYGEALQAETWNSERRRELLYRRETRVADALEASVDWVYVGASGPVRAPPELVAAFPICEPGKIASFPELPPLPAPVDLPSFHLVPWHTEMDPQGHLNHPRYIDWGDEWISRWLMEKGKDPISLSACADHVRFRLAAVAGDRVRIQGQLIAAEGDRRTFAIRAQREGGDLLVEQRLVRQHPDWPEG
jgi:acyl-CoA thioester hydrolase